MFFPLCLSFVCGDFVVIAVVVIEKEKGVVVLHLPIVPLKGVAVCWPSTEMRTLCPPADWPFTRTLQHRG